MPRSNVVMAIIRILIGALFVSTGVMKFAGHAQELTLFKHWGVPLPELAVYGVGVLEFAAGGALVLGIVPRVAALLLLIDMTGALIFAGRVDKGQYLVVPVVLGIGLALIAKLGGGPWQLRPSLSESRPSGPPQG